MFAAQVFAIQVMVLAMVAGVAIWVRQDAIKRGMSSHWGTGVFFLLIVFLPLYFVVRRRTAECRACGTDVGVSVSLGKDCEQPDQQDPALGRPGRFLG